MKENKSNHFELDKEALKRWAMKTIPIVFWPALVMIISNLQNNQDINWQLVLAAILSAFGDLLRRFITNYNKDNGSTQM